MEPIVDEMVTALLRYLRVHSADRETQRPVPIDLSKAVNFFTMDVITRIAFGRQLGCLARDADVHGLLAALADAMKTYTIPLSVPWLRDITTSDAFLRYFGPRMTDKAGMGALMRYAPACSPFQKQKS